MTDSSALPWMLGVVEGFYGRPWRMHERTELFTQMSNWGMNTYVYAPKDDIKHRACWRELYTSEELDELGDLVAEARRNNIEFVYAIAPGLNMVYSSEQEQQLLHEKLNQVHEIGCSSFAVLFDDIEKDMCTTDQAEFESVAHAHCHVTNQVLAFLGPKRLLFCPTEYCASRSEPNVKDSQYLRTVGTHLDPNIQVLWTGDAVIPEYISEESLEHVNLVIRRKCVIWDNIHANDYDPRRVFLGPYFGRSPKIRDHVDGVLTNPNCEYSTNFIALHTLSAWSSETVPYDPRAAFEFAVEDWFAQLTTHGSPRTKGLDKYGLIRICDMFYLPYQHGDTCNNIINEFLFLEETSASDTGWKDRCTALQEECNDIIALCKRIAAFSCGFAKDIYPYLWELQEMLAMVSCVLERLESGAQRPTRTHRPHSSPSLALGGMLASLQLLVLPYGSVHGTSICTAHRVYSMRPCFESDRDYLYDLCFKASVSTSAPTDEHSTNECPSLLGDRWVGPYLTLPSCLAYVLEDNQGVCGYVLAAVDSRAFYDDLQTLYIPTLANKYTAPSGSPTEWKPLDHLLHELLNPTFYLDDEIMEKYPSHLHIDLLPRAQNQGNGRRLVELLLRNLQACGSVGVHLEAHPDNTAAHQFYEKLGFTKLNVSLTNKVFFGKTWVQTRDSEAEADTEMTVEELNNETLDCRHDSE